MKFGTTAVGDGYAAVCERTGRQVGAIRNYAGAKRDADSLNEAAKRGRKALCRALGATEDDGQE